jgi:hypothetical protein
MYGGVELVGVQMSSKIPEKVKVDQRSSPVTKILILIIKKGFRCDLTSVHAVGREKL